MQAALMGDVLHRVSCDVSVTSVCHVMCQFIM